MKIVLISICLFFHSFLHESFGQSLEIGYSLGVKVGLESFDGFYAEGVEFQVLKKKTLFSSQYLYHREIPILNPEPREMRQQFNLMLGSFKSLRSFRFEYQAGLGVIWGIERTNVKKSGFITDVYESEKFLAPSVPLRVGIKYVPTKFMSIGVDFLLNLNMVNPYSRPMLSLNFGKMK